MRIVVQRVKNASVFVDDRLVGKIGKGYFVLFGVSKNDKEKSALVLAEKLSKLRIMADENAKMNKTLNETAGEVLVVSQFTLYADTKGGNRPSFINAAGGELAEKMYLAFINKLKELGLKVSTGEFGAYMKIESELDGPATIIMEDES